LKCLEQKVSSKRLDKWKKLEDLASPLSNFKDLRQFHDGVTPPLIPTPSICFFFFFFFASRWSLSDLSPPPHTALFLKDLLFIQDGNEDWYDAKKKLVSWVKIKLLGKVISRIQLSLEVPYKLNVRPALSNPCLSCNDML